MARTIWRADLADHQMMSCLWRRIVRGPHPLAPCRTGREKGDQTKHRNLFVFHIWNNCFSLCFISFILEANGQICVRRSLHSPTAENGRKALCCFLLASLANTPLLSQCLKQQKMTKNISDIVSLLTFWNFVNYFFLKRLTLSST